MASFTPRATPLIAGRVVRAHYSMKQLYEGLLFAINKVRAPSLDVEQFNDLFQTSNDNYYKKRYEQFFDRNQQSSDDFRDISATANLTTASTPPLDLANERFALPGDYHHTTAVILFWRIRQAFKSYKLNSTLDRAAKRITPQELGENLPDYYRRQSFENPKYLMRPDYVELVTGNHANVLLEKVSFSYLMLPEEALLLTSDLDDPTLDPSVVLRQPGVVTREVLKEMTKLVLENQGDPRWQSKAVVDQALAAQAAPQAPPAAPGGRR